MLCVMVLNMTIACTCLLPNISYSTAVEPVNERRFCRRGSMMGTNSEAIREAARRANAEPMSPASPVAEWSVMGTNPGATREAVRRANEPLPLAAEEAA